ncbi:MAG: hypothetical protein P4L99_28100 [Chthoniobacter sp.]|nr:hypothetical protein [Chthoniobacter sp.]
MPATDVKFGITRNTGALIETLESTDKVEKKVLKGSDGNAARVKTFNPTTTFSVKGHGTLTIVPGIGTSGITDIAGGITVIDEVKRDEKNDDFDGWSYSGENYPNAQSV